MDYATLTTDDRRAIRMERLRELEIAHVRMSLEEREEPGCSPQRTEALGDLRRRISEHQEALGFTEHQEALGFTERNDEKTSNAQERSVGS